MAGVKKRSNLLYRLFMVFRARLPRNVNLFIRRLHYRIYGYRMPWSALRFEVHITDNCNLNCAGCMHFCNLTDGKNFLPVSEYERDLKRLAQLSGGETAGIRIMGGEPLLHPKLTDILDITRKYFSNNNIGGCDLVTNGILLLRQGETFWQSAARNGIIIEVSDYPISLDVEKINETAKRYGVDMRWLGSLKGKRSGVKDQWCKVPIDLEGKQNIRKSFGECYFAGGCFQLVEGKIYKCARIAFVKYFNKAFNKNLVVSEKDYVDIYKAEHVNEILNALCDPAPFCRYCRSGETTWNEKWRMSKKEIEEFV